MRKVFDRTEKIELNSFVKDFVNLREKFFTPEDFRRKNFRRCQDKLF